MTTVPSNQDQPQRVQEAKQATLEDLKSVLPKAKVCLSVEEMDEAIGESINETYSSMPISGRAC